ncbi:MAG: hypothetical protein J5I93_08580, partial [Pirellulaceae bacterium]|nr:hypothetical protein [Pirellulaceae bacterium]
MTNPSAATTVRRRRIWSDPFFYVLLAAISATYVVLILAMLLADATYLFTSDMREDGRVDFETYRGPRQEELFRPGDVVSGQMSAHLGLQVSAEPGQPALWPMILDSSQPPAGGERLGTPGQAYGGPGVGAAG